MESIWDILEIEKTDDIGIIKKAYGIMAARYNPEEYPEEFLRIREAYEQALKSAEGGTIVQEPEKREEFHWDFNDEISFQEGPAIQKFRELYSGSRKKDRNAWSDYFLSPEFLASYRELDFLSAMYDTVCEKQDDFPPGREFLTELYITYGLEAPRMPEGKIEPEEGAAFDGIKKVLEIAAMGPVIKRFKENDEAMKCGFRDYRLLLKLAASGLHAEEEQILLGEIIDRYTLSNISDKPVINAYQYGLSQRHPKSIRLLNYFYSSNELPESFYDIAWTHLHLDNKLLGKEKLLYGELKEAVLAHMPNIAQNPKLDYQKVIGKLNEYRLRFAAEDESPEAKEETGRLFEQEDFQAAMLDRRFVEQHLLKYFILQGTGRFYIERLKEFYANHPNAPLQGQVLKEIKLWEKNYRVKRELEEDERGSFDFGGRPFLRYYLNAGFHRAKGLKYYNTDLKSFLAYCLPFSPEWTKKLLNPEIGGFEEGNPAAAINFDENVLEVIFYPKHIAYRWNGKDYWPYYPWEFLRDAQDELFWMLLPIAQAPFQEHEDVFSELVQRLSFFPLQQEDIEVIADCISGKICHFEEENNSFHPYFTFYEEIGERLLGCDVYNNGEMAFFEETDSGEQPLPTGQYYSQDMDMASGIAHRVFKELRDLEKGINIALPERMPKRLLIKDRWGSPCAIEGDQLTKQVLQDNLEQFFSGNRIRVELEWDGASSLVFRKERRQNRYLCMYFNHQKCSWNALTAQPELYAAVDENQVRYVLFEKGMIPDYLVHQNTYLIQNLLKDIFNQIGTEDPKPAPIMWDSHVHMIREKLRYHRDMLIYGDFPPELAKNPLTADFDISVLPSKLLWTDMTGQQNEHAVDARRDGMMVQDRLRDYMSGRLAQLSLIWQTADNQENSGENTAVREIQIHKIQIREISLLQDNGKHRMTYLDGNGDARCFVSDVGEYMQAEGKKYRKETFSGKTVPGYLVHENLERIRGCLDLILPEIENPERFINEFGEFASES